MANTTIDMTEGRPLPLLLRFGLPTLAGNLLHQAYSLTDGIIVGKYLGKTALAAVGCTMPIVLLLAALMVGINIAVGILIGQHFGRRDEEGMRRSFLNSLYLGLFISAVVAAVGGAASEQILLWMGTPAGPLADATTYLRINFITTICPLLYFMFSSAFRGMGDSRTGLWCLIISVVSNIGLDVLFVAVLELGVAGSAWATALAQGLSAVVAMVLFWKKYPVFRPSADDLRPDPALLWRVTKLAGPIALQTAFTNLGNLVAQSGVNTFDETVMAAYTAANRLGALALMPLETIGGTLSVYAGQNYGAGKPERIRSGVRVGLVLVLIVSTVLGVVLLLTGSWLITLFLDEVTPETPEIIAAARSYLLIAAVPGVRAGIMYVFQQVLRGTNHPNHAMAGGLTELAVKIGVVALGAWRLHSLNVVWLAWPLSFVGGMLWPLIYYYKGSRIRPREQNDGCRAED